MLKTIAAATLRTLMPQRYRALRAVRQNRHGGRVLSASGLDGIARSFMGRHGCRVLSGPFAGMSYVRSAVGAPLLPKIIGSYECELAEALRRILSCRYDSVVDVGCAEGYYAVGLALRLPGRPAVHAYDLDPAARRLCAVLAALNGVQERVLVKGRCDAAEIGRVLRGRGLIICDCEGYEVDLLDPAATPALASADLLVEMHDCLRPGTTATLLARFAATHHQDLIDSRDRDPSDYACLEGLAPEARRLALAEFRHGPMQWAFLRARSSWPTAP